MLNNAHNNGVFKHVSVVFQTLSSRVIDCEKPVC